MDSTGSTALGRKGGVLGIVLFIALGASTQALAASFDCDAGGLSRTQIAICEDAQLSRADEATARRIAGFARRMNYGQYLGLRHWHAASARQRTTCGTDKACLAGHYRAQARFLDRLQQCLDTNTARRGCLRSTLSGGEREAVRRLP